MSTFRKPPPVMITGNVVCHNIEFSAAPQPGEASLANGEAVGRLILGFLPTGQPMVLEVADLGYLGRLEDAARVLATRMRMFSPDLTLHPFGDRDCWADRLTAGERRVLAGMLAGWARQFYDAAPDEPSEVLVGGCLMASAEMNDLHLDVTEPRAAAA